MICTPSAGLAAGAAFSHADRATSLYRRVVSMGEDGAPRMPLAVMAGQTEVEVRASGTLRVVGTEDEAVTLSTSGKDGARVSLVVGAPGRVRYYVKVGAAPAGSMQTLRKMRQRWRDLGHGVRIFNVGTTYSLGGRMIDTQRSVIALDTAYDTRQAAAKRADALAAEVGEDLGVHTELERPPRAVVRVSLPGGATLEGSEVLWFEALDSRGRPAPVTVIGTRGRNKRWSLELPGRVSTVPGLDGKMTVVNEAPLERILEGVVASEIFASAPLEALKSQAVAARTDMLSKVGRRHRTDPYSICGEVHCQAYRGTKKVSPRIARAVRETAGMVMMDGQGGLVDAFYSAVAGGHTEHNENAWDGRPRPTLRGQPDYGPGDVDPLAGGVTEAGLARLLGLDGRPAAVLRSWAARSGRNKKAVRWTATRTAADLQRSLQRVGVDEPVKAIEVVRRGVSGRATDVALTLASGKRKKIHGELRIRRALGRLRSSLFVVVAGPAGKSGVPTRFVFEGAGYGHGVGMCQTGAVGRADAGQDFRTITGHYYQGSTVEKLY
jgi:SpoIID/LytB domain protein